jgi:hypothetical protein
LLHHQDDDDGQDDQDDCHNGHDAGAVAAVWFGLLFFILHVRGQKSIHANEAFASRNSIVSHHREFSFITSSRQDSVDLGIRIAVNVELLVHSVFVVVFGP